MESSYRRFSVTAPIAAFCVSLYATPHFVLRPVLSQLSMQFTSVRSLIFIIFREKGNCCVQISFSAHSSITFFYRNCKVKIWQNKGKKYTYIWKKARSFSLPHQHYRCQNTRKPDQIRRRKAGVQPDDGQGCRGQRFQTGQECRFYGAYQRDPLKEQRKRTDSPK